MTGGALALYFFHRLNGTADFDREGLEFSGLDEARHEAIIFASDTLKDERFSLWRGGEVRIEVAGQDRIVLFTVFLKAENAAPLNGRDDPTGR